MNSRTISHALAILALGSAAFSGSARADLVTLTMDEVPFQPINGLTVTKGFESFTFSDPGNTLLYHARGPGDVTYVQDPSIEGSNEPFSVSFATPVDFIQFGLAESTEAPLTGASVTLSDGTVLSFNLPLADPFAEGQFTWSGEPVTAFELTPAPGASGIAFDNLTVGAPEPSAVALFVAGLAGLRLVRRRNKA